jgi:hypothetical protein
MPLSAGTGIHWQVAQATSLQNIVFNMRSDGGTANQQQVNERMMFLGHSLTRIFRASLWTMDLADL